MANLLDLWADNPQGTKFHSPEWDKDMWFVPAFIDGKCIIGVVCGKGARYVESFDINGTFWKIYEEPKKTQKYYQFIMKDDESIFTSDWYTSKEEAEIAHGAKVLKIAATDEF